MTFNIILKVLISMIVGLVFWVWAFVVFMVYAFMPISKTSHSIIFSVIAPLLYLTIVNWLLKRIFKETGRKNALINFAVSFLTMALALLFIDTAAKIIR